MKKLPILKSLVDFIWIITCIPLIPIILFFTVYIFIEPSVILDNLEMSSNLSEDAMNGAKVFVLLFFVMVYALIYAFYLFRKTLRSFQKRQPFALTVIKNFETIGRILIISGISMSVLFFVYRLVFANTFKISLGVTPYLGCVCLGLFFLVLSELFRVAKSAKEENQLTI